MFKYSRLPSALARALVLTLGMTLAACGGADDSSSGGDVPASGSVIGTVTGDIIVIDRDMMSDLPCHAMDNTIMGLCGEDDVDAMLAEMGLNKDEIILHDMQLMSEEACHVMERTIMGTCTDEDVERLAEEVRLAP